MANEIGQAPQRRNDAFQAGTAVNRAYRSAQESLPQGPSNRAPKPFFKDNMPRVMPENKFPNKPGATPAPMPRVTPNKFPGATPAPMPKVLPDMSRYGK